jgi:hypothetical protein
MKEKKKYIQTKIEPSHIYSQTTYPEWASTDPEWASTYHIETTQIKSILYMQYKPLQIQSEH